MEKLRILVIPGSSLEATVAVAIDGAKQSRHWYESRRVIAPR